MKNASTGIIAKARYLIQGLSLLLLLVLAAGCSEQSELRYIPEQGTILAFGDSLTAGVGAAAGDDYPSQLQQLTGRRVINAGISGEETRAGLQRLPGLLDHYQPDLLILLEGGNDILRNRGYGQIHSNLSKMLEQAQQREIPVILLAVPEKKLFSDSAPFYRELAEQFPVVFADQIVADLLRTPRYKSDPIHLNRQGYGRLAETIQQLLIEHNAL